MSVFKHKNSSETPQRTWSTLPTTQMLAAPSHILLQDGWGADAGQFGKPVPKFSSETTLLCTRCARNTPDYQYHTSNSADSYTTYNNRCFNIHTVTKSNWHKNSFFVWTALDWSYLNNTTVHANTVKQFSDSHCSQLGLLNQCVVPHWAINLNLAVYLTDTEVMALILSTFPIV